MTQHVLEQPLPPYRIGRLDRDFDDFDPTYDLPRDQSERPALDEIDQDGLDGEDADIRLGLERWGDLQFPSRLINS